MVVLYFSNSMPGIIGPFLMCFSLLISISNILLFCNSPVHWAWGSFGAPPRFPSAVYLTLYKWYLFLTGKCWTRVWYWGRRLRWLGGRWYYWGLQHSREEANPWRGISFHGSCNGRSRLIEWHGVLKLIYLVLMMEPKATQVE